MRAMDIRARIFAAIGVGGLVLGNTAACGSEGSTNPVNVDAGGDAATRADSSGDASPSPADAAKPADAASSDAPIILTDTGASDTSFDGPSPSPRRPFLVGSSLRVAEVSERDDWASPLGESAALDPSTAEWLGRSWLADAREEHASIAAFARFTLLLLSVGAPPDLVLASQRASIDEIRHARGCFALARRYSGRSAGPGALVVSDALGAMSLAEMAALTAEEGAVGETLGVVLATEQLALATDPEVRALPARIVTDEARHAELSWGFLRWAIAKGGAPVRRAAEHAFRAAIDKTRATPTRTYDVALAAWHAHGRLTCAEARAVTERGIRDVLEPCASALFRLEPVAQPALA